MEETKISMKEFAEKHELTMDATRAIDRPDGLMSGDEMIHWLVTLQSKKTSEAMSLFFSHGMGWMPSRELTNQEKAWLRRSPTPNEGYAGEREDLLKKIGRLNEYGKERLKKMPFVKPGIEDVLYSVADDIRSIEDYDDMDEWLEDLGFSTDLKTIRKGEKAYRETRRYMGHMRGLLGSREAYEEFLYGTDGEE